MCLTDPSGGVSVAITKWQKGMVECFNLLNYDDKNIIVFDPKEDKHNKFLCTMSNIVL